MNILACTSSDCSLNSLRPEHEIYISLAKAGHTITIITHENAPYKQLFLDNNIQLIEHPITKKISFNSIRLIRQIIKKKSIDIIYATNSKSIPNAAFACIGTAAKLVAYRGTASGLYWYDPGNYLGALNPRVNGIICVSKYVYKYVSSKKVLKNKRITSIYKGHDLSWYDKEPVDLNEFGIDKNAFTAICVINSRPHKGVDIALKAADMLADIEYFHLILVGNGTEKEPYKSLLKNNKMKSRIHLAGYRQDAPELIAASDVLIQPSTSGEGLPRVILESLAYGTPVIASANKGSMEIIDDGVNGSIVPIRDPQAIADQIRKLIKTPDILKTYTTNSKDKIKNEMSHDLTVKNYIAYFESLIKS
jgi:glycosyltransferase involved in cell wall biosynthesis